MAPAPRGRGRPRPKASGGNRSRSSARARGTAVSKTEVHVHVGGPASHSGGKGGRAKKTGKKGSGHVPAQRTRKTPVKKTIIKKKIVHKKPVQPARKTKVVPRVQPAPAPAPPRIITRTITRTQQVPVPVPTPVHVSVPASKKTWRERMLQFRLRRARAREQRAANLETRWKQRGANAASALWPPPRLVRLFAPLNQRVWGNRRAARAQAVRELEQIQQSYESQRTEEFRKNVGQHLRAFEHIHRTRINRLGPNRRTAIQLILARTPLITNPATLATMDAYRVLLTDALVNKRYGEASAHIYAMEQLLP